MRPIKLRIWHKAERMMFLATSITFNKKGNVIAGYARELLGEFAWAIDEVELLQFTGLLDCNGKEIFEGDIVRNAPNNDIQGQSEVFFGNGCYEPFHYLGLSSSCFEIIGNIYENKELLEVCDDE